MTGEEAYWAGLGPEDCWEGGEMSIQVGYLGDRLREVEAQLVDEIDAHKQTKKRLEKCEALYAASESLRRQMQEQAVKDLTVFNQVRERLEQCEALQPKQRERIAACLNGNEFPATAWGKGYCAGILAALTAFDDAARAAVEEK